MESIKKIGGILVILAVSVLVGFFLTNLMVETIPSIGNTFLPFGLLGLFTAVIAIGLRRLFTGSGSGGKKQRDPWGSPEAVRDRVVNSPQFVGRFDREKGLLETTARMVANDSVSYQKWYMGKAATHKIIRFRGELLDQNGSPLEYIPVEIRADDSKWVGNIADGDRLRINGKIEDDGILHSKNAFNYSTNSWVGQK
jgi:hypothetical protein